MNLKQLIKFGIEESSVPVIKNPILRAALEPRSAVHEPRNMAHGGRIGFRYGSSSFDAHTKREAAFKAYKDYKKSYYNSRQRNPIITFREFLPIYAKENFADGGSAGQLVRNTVDGSRPGYAKDTRTYKEKYEAAEKRYTIKSKPPKKKKWKGVFGKDAANEIFNDYEKFYTDAYNNKNMSQVGEAQTYFKQVYEKDFEKAMDLLRRHGYTNLKARPYELKQKLLNELIDNAQGELKYTNKFNIIDKVFTEAAAKYSRAKGLSSFLKTDRKHITWFTEDLLKKINSLDKMEDKISKALDYMVKNNVEIKDIKVTGSADIRSPIKKTIASLVDNGKDGISRAHIQNGLKKNKWYQSQTVNGKNLFDYVSRTYGNEFVGDNFNDAYEFSKNRFSRVKVKGSSQMRLPESLMWQFGVRSADRNFKVGNYDNSPVKITDLKGNNIDYGSLPVNEQGQKIIDPKKHKFTYNGTLYGKNNLISEAKKTGDFKEVYNIASEWKTYKDTLVPDPDNPKGPKIKFSKLLDDSGIDKFMAIGHDDALGGVKDKPYSNFKIQNKFVNKSLDSAYRQVKNKDLRKRIANEIWGDLKGKTGDAYREAWVKQNTKLLNDINSGRLNIDTMDTPYRQAGKTILGSEDFIKFSPKKQMEVARVAGFNTVDFMKNRRILLEKAKANAALKTANKGGFLKQVQKICRLAKSSGGRIGFFNGGIGDDTCPLIDSDPKRFLNEIVKVDKGVVGKFFKTPQAVKFAKGIARSTLNLANPFSWIGGEAFYVGLEGMNSISKGMPWDEAFDDAFIFYDFETVNKNIIDTASKMNLDENSMALLKNTMNINKLDSDMGKVQSQLEMVESDPLSEIDVSSSHDRINEIQGQLDNEIQSYMSNVGELFNKDPNTLDNSEIYKGFNILSNIFRKKVLTERQDAYKDIATRADPLAGNLGNWLNTNLFNLDVWKPKHLLTTKLTPQQEKQKYLDEIGNEFIPGTKIPNPKYNPRELYLYNRDARNLTYDSPLVDEALALRKEGQSVLGTGWYSNKPYASGGRAGYMGGGIAAIRKPHAIPPERQGLRSIMINGKKS